MANSDIENFVTDFGSGVLVGASTPRPVRDLKSLLSIARQDRAPLESSNTSNCTQSNNRGLHTAANKNREEFNGRIAGAEFSRISADNDHPCEESICVDSGQGRWEMLSARLDEHSYSILNDTASELVFDRQAVETVEDRFRDLCSPPQLEHFFEEIIDVDREVGFGEDDDFGGQQTDSGNESCETSDFYPTITYGRRSTQKGREEGHLLEGIGVIGLNDDPRGDLGEFVSDGNRKVLRSCTTVESGKETTGGIEGFVRNPSLQESEFHRSLSNQYLRYSVGEEDERLTFKLRPEASSVDYEKPENDEWMPLKSEPGEELVALENRQSEWETERTGEQVYEVGTWNENEPGVEQQENSIHEGQESYPLENKPENVDEVIRDMLAEMTQGDGVHESDGSLQEAPAMANLVHAAIGKRHTDCNGNPYSLIILGFEDLLREADGRVERERRTVEDVVRIKEETEEDMRNQHMQWSETEKQLEGRINALESQQSRLSDMLRETEVALTVEKERRKDSRTEVDRILEMLKKERKSHQETLAKLSTCVNSLMKLRGNLALQKSRSAEDGGPSYLQVVDTVLADMDRELQINLTHWTRKSSEVDYKSSEIDELSRWKQQRDALEEERDKVEENMSSLLRRTRERHGEMEILWLERETLLEQKVGYLEVELQHSQMSQRRKEVEVLTERQRWAEELQKRRKYWAHERTVWEATVREREERLGAALDCIPKASEENSLTAKVVDEVFLEESEASDYDCKEIDSMRNQSRDLQDAVRRARSLDSNDVALDDKISQFCVDIGNLALGMEAGVEKATEDLRSREGQWETDRMQWKEEEESFIKERREMEKRIADAVTLLEELKMEMNAKEAEMDAERKQMQTLLLQKASEVDRLAFQVKSKEHDMEVTVQKFMDEVRLIDKEVEKERKEREQVMELHFASKRKVVTDMKEREEKWDKEIECMKLELDKMKMDNRNKEKEIEELKRSNVRAPSDRDRQMAKTVASLQHEKDVLAAELAKEKGEVRRAMERMLADVWKVCEEEQIQAAVAKRLGPGEELSRQRPMWEFLWSEYCKNKGISDDHRSMEWEVAVGKIARFDKELSEAMTVIETLRGELKMSEVHLLEAKADTKTKLEEKEREWTDEQKRLIKLLESQLQKERELKREWQVKEQDHIKEKEAIEESFKVGQDESTEAVSNLQGVVRELEWVLKQSKSPKRDHDSDGRVIRRGLTQSAAKSSDLVKVHASYLEEVDRYIVELEAKMEVSEKRYRSPERVFARRDRKWGRDPEMNSALLKIERELFSTPESQGQVNNSPDSDRVYLPPRSSRDWDTSGGGLSGTSKRVTHKRVPRTLDRNMCLTLNGLATLAQDTWADGADEWQLEDRNSSSSIASWMSPRSSTEDLSSSHELPAHGVLALPCSSPSIPSKRQQKWVVDVNWLEQVRKEHTWLRQQLEIERQRVSALGRVEADNRWIEAAIIRALELKRESETRVADMQQKVNVMEMLMAKKNSLCSTP